MNRARGRISIRRTDSQPLTPAEILRTVGSSECAPVDYAPAFSEGYQLGALVVGLIVSGAGFAALVVALFT